MMKDCYKRFREWFVNNILSIIQILAPMAYVIYRKFFAIGTPISMFEGIMLAIVSLELTIMIGKSIWNRYSYQAYTYPWSKISSNYTVESRKITYRVTENDTLEYSRSVTIKSHINHMDSIVDKYIWTGKSKAGLPTGEEGIRRIENDNIIGVWNYFRVIFDGIIRKGDSKTIKYKWPPIEDCSSSSSFFSASTEEPTKKLILELEMGAKYAKKPVFLEEIRALESYFVISTQIVELDERGCYTWDVQRIKRFRHYRMRWSWEDSEIPNLPT